ncbi:MAG: hypothetical protein Q9186_000522 [Xanthomendoza sp. 1 TL-2023]
MSKAGLYIKMFATHATLSKHPRATVTDLRQKYNPDLQRKSLENRQGRQQDFDNFVTKLKEYSKSDRPIWEAAAQDEARTKANSAEEQKRLAAEIQKRREEIKRQAINGQ